MQSVTDRVAPHDIDAQAAVLGSAFQSDRHAAMVLDSLEEDDFYGPIHRPIFRAMKAARRAGQAVDPVTIKNAMPPETYEAIGGMAPILAVFDVSYHSSHVEHYISILLEKSGRRSMMRMAGELWQGAFCDGDADQVRIAIARRLLNINGRGSTDAMHVRDIIREVREKLSKGPVLKKSGGFRIGFKIIDGIIGRLMYGEESVIFGRTSMGKSVVALAFALGAARLMQPALLVSYEVLKLRLALRILAQVCKIPARVLAYGDSRDATAFDRAVRAVDQAMEELAAMPFYILDASKRKPGYADTRRVALQIAQETGRMPLIIKDRVELIGEPKLKGEDPTHYIARKAEMGHDLATELETHLILVAQANRKIEDQGRVDKRPTLADLRQSGALEECAQNVFGVHRPAKYDPHSADKELIELPLLKCSDGKAGIIIPMRWQEMFPGIYDFADADKRLEMLMREVEGGRR